MQSSNKKHCKEELIVWFTSFYSILFRFHIVDPILRRIKKSKKSTASMPQHRTRPMRIEQVDLLEQIRDLLNIGYY